MSKPLFSLLHATDRHPQWSATAKIWKERAKNPDAVEHILVTGSSTRYDAMRDALWFPHRDGVVFRRTRIRPLPESRGGVDQWNEAAAVATGTVLIKMADDLLPPLHWDAFIEDAFGNRMEVDPEPTLKQSHVLDVAYRSHEDGPLLDCGSLIPHAIITRPYYERFGYLEHPDYSHNMADVEFSDVAHASGCVIKRHDIVFIHKNPEDGSAEWDEVYRRQRTPEKLAEARAIYEKRKSLGFPKESVLPLLEAQCTV